MTSCFLSTSAFIHCSFACFERRSDLQKKQVNIHAMLSCMLFLHEISRNKTNRRSSNVVYMRFYEEQSTFMTCYHACSCLHEISCERTSKFIQCSHACVFLHETPCKAHQHSTYVFTWEHVKIIRIHPMFSCMVCVCTQHLMLKHQRSSNIIMHAVFTWDLKLITSTFIQFLDMKSFKNIHSHQIS